MNKVAYSSIIGSSSTVLFSLKPNYRIIKSKSSSNGFYQWLNTKSFGLPHGLGIGGTVEGFRLFIPESLEHCVAKSSCPTFEPGRLIPLSDGVGNDTNSNTFEIDVLEIWGCGGDSIVSEALDAQAKDRMRVDEAICKARKVDKAAFFNNEFDKEFLLSNTLSHQKQSRENHSDF